jgi:hypothetical protein
MSLMERPRQDPDCQRDAEPGEGTISPVIAGVVTSAKGGGGPNGIWQWDAFPVLPFDDLAVVS